MKRKILASGEMANLAKRSSNKRIEVYSFFPVDRAGCDCYKKIKEWQNKLAKYSEKRRRDVINEVKYLTCPRNKAGMRRRVITCRACGEVQGYLWARDNTLRDWCNFHYVQWTEEHIIKVKGKKPTYEHRWHGCFTPHISPITQQLCLECCCGNDTRDFRANMTMKAIEAFKIEEKNKVGREFGRSDSKFTSRIVGSDVIPFK